MSDELIPTKREEEFLRGIMRAVGGEESSVPEPVWDYEKRLYDIWLAAKGEDPIYNLPVHTEHPDAFYNAIRDALVEGGGGGSSPTLGSVTIVNNTSKNISVSGVRNVGNGVIDSGTTSIYAGQSGDVFMIPAYGSATEESVGYVSDVLVINLNQSANASLTGSGADISKIGKVGATNKYAYHVYAPVGTILTLSVIS